MANRDEIKTMSKWNFGLRFLIYCEQNELCGNNITLVTPVTLAQRFCFFFRASPGVVNPHAVSITSFQFAIEFNIAWCLDFKWPVRDLKNMHDLHTYIFFVGWISIASALLDGEPRSPGIGESFCNTMHAALLLKSFSVESFSHRGLLSSLQRRSLLINVLTKLWYAWTLECVQYSWAHE